MTSEDIKHQLIIIIIFGGGGVGWVFVDGGREGEGGGVVSRFGLAVRR